MLEKSIKTKFVHKYHITISGVLEMIDGFTKVITFGHIFTNYSLNYMIKVTKRDLKRRIKNGQRC